LSKNAAGSKVRSFAFGAFSIGLTLLGTRLPLECSLSVICFEYAQYQKARTFQRGLEHFSMFSLEACQRLIRRQR
jgi:hypothetical protein